MYRKKLIETQIPLEAINKEAAREKSIKHGHPSTLHLWWSRKPLAATRAVLWASLVDDPEDDSERERLTKILEKLVVWENTNDPDVLAEARRALPDPLPVFLDPFAGGGSIPLEAQRLSLNVHAHDLNPVAVILNKAMIELPPKFAGLHPVHPDPQGKFSFPAIKSEGRAVGLAEDVQYYGELLKARAFEKIGGMYPKILTDEGEASVIAWLWARTVECPNCKRRMPLVSSFMLSRKKNHEAWVMPHVHDQEITYTVETHGTPPKEVKTGRGAFICAGCGGLAKNEYLHEQFSAHRDGRVMIAVAAEGKKGRQYLTPTPEQVEAADVPMPESYPDAEMNQDCTDLISGRGYGFTHWHQLFTNRQLTMLTTFCDLLPEIRSQIQEDARRAGRDDPEEYAEAVCVYLAFVIDKLTQYNSSFGVWDSTRDGIAQIFGKQAIPMVWDYPESNPFCNSTGSFKNMLRWVVNALTDLPARASGEASQHDAQTPETVDGVMISTDPPYYDNIGYADLSDYFYIWLRRNLREIYPSLFRRAAVPKTEELIATPYRHEGDKAKAQAFFESGMLEAFRNMYRCAREDYPVTIYYAYKEKESSAGWETMLKAVITAGFQVTATWPVRTELTTALKAKVAALGSSVVFVCRKRPETAEGTTKGRYDSELSELAELRKGGIAPVDIPQAAIGKGMAVYSKYPEIVDTSGHVLTVSEALQDIYRQLDPDGMTLDSESGFCAELYGLAGWADMKSDDALKISRPRGVALDELVRSGVLSDLGDRVRLTERADLKRPRGSEWESVSLWRCAQLLTQELRYGGGNEECGSLVAAMGQTKAERVRELVYRLYAAAERRKLDEDARMYNDLVKSWPKILELAVKAEQKVTRTMLDERQGTLGFERKDDD